MSIGASVVILVVLVVRLLFRKAPKIFSYSLWLFVLIRLIFPITFESKASILSVPSTLSDRIVEDIPVTVEVIKGTMTETIVASHSISLLDILSIVWICGMLGLILYTIVCYIKIKKTLKYSIKMVDNIYESESISMPFVFGIFKPKIYIPLNLNKRQKQIILAHEIIHVERKDTLIKSIALIVTMIHWFNPFVWLSFYVMSKDMEYSCDEKVIRRLGDKCKQSFGMTLLEFAINPYIMVVSFSESNTKERIKHMLNYKKPSFWVLLACLLIGGLLIIPLLSNPTKESKPSPTPTIEVTPTPEVSTTPTTEPSTTPSAETENKEVSYIAPLKNFEVTCGWGCYAGHDAIDIKDPSNKNADIYAIAEGSVEEVGFDKSTGNYIVIDHGDSKSFYGQMKNESSLKEGDSVKQGDVIGVTGMTGQASGEHLHFAIMDSDGNKLSNTLELIQ